MKNLITLFFSFVVSITLSSAGSSEASYDFGYTVGYYFGLLWPYIAVAAVVYIIYRIVKRSKQAKA
jgi:hypothetical protein